MAALNQYLDLYRQHGDLIAQHSAAPLNALRHEAYRVLESATLPKTDSDNYENCNLEAMLAPDFGLNIAKMDLGVDPRITFSCDVPMLSTSLFMLINDTFAETSKSRDSLPEGVEVGSLRKWAEKDPKGVADYYGTLADINNPMVALNTLLAQDGLYIRIRKGVKVEKTIQLINILDSAAPLMAVRRLLIILEEEASAKLLVCDHTQKQDVDFLGLETIEIFAGANSEFDYYSLEESSEKTGRISTLFLKQEACSKVGIDGITLFNGTTRNEYYCRMDGEDAELHLYGMGIEDAQRRTSVYTHISHNAPRCKSNELFKFTLDDEAAGAFTGRIYVAPGAVKTEAYQSNRNLIGSDDAKMHTRPELEIYNDDVKCSHGSAIGQLDAGQMFYMRTRGLDEATARLLLKQAFMADVIDGIRVPALRDRLHIMVERRFAGESSACAHCPTSDITSCGCGCKS